MTRAPTAQDGDGGLQFRVLGGHQVESRDGSPIAFLIDDTIAIDAGGLCRSLTMAEQAAIHSILITHYHYDHVRDLPFLGLGALDGQRQVNVYCSQLVKDALSQHLLCPPLWLDLFGGLDPNAPTFLYHRLQAAKPVKIGDYQFMPIENRHHAVPVLGFEIATVGRRRLVYTGDTGAGIRDIWPLVDPDVMVTEVTWPNRMEDMAYRAGHLTSALLEAELVAYRELKGKLPRVLACHANQAYETEVRRELDEVARRLRAEIDVAEEGTLIDL